MKYYFLAFKNCLDFSGKSSKKEFWYFFLIDMIIHIFLGILEGAFPEKSQLVNNIESVYIITTILPYLSLGFRRLKDAGYNKFLFFIPIVNLILASMDSSKNVSS